MNKHFSQLTCIVVAALSLATAVHADSARDKIQEAYNRSNRAMKMKYVDGILSIRMPTYEAYDMRGQPVSIQRELKTLSSLLNQAREVTETTDITQFVQISDREAKARIRDAILVNFSADNQRPPLLIKSIADDTWVHVGQDWKLQTTRILQQSTASN